MAAIQGIEGVISQLQATAVARAGKKRTRSRR